MGYRPLAQADGQLVRERPAERCLSRPRWSMQQSNAVHMHANGRVREYDVRRQ